VQALGRRLTGDEQRRDDRPVDRNLGEVRAAEAGQLGVDVRVVSIASRGASRNGSSAATFPLLAGGASAPRAGIGSKGCSDDGRAAGGGSMT
jgi:hypothetical protein